MIACLQEKMSEGASREKENSLNKIKKGCQEIKNTNDYNNLPIDVNKREIKNKLTDEQFNRTLAEGEDLDVLGNFQHTEIQIAAMYQAYQKVEQDPIKEAYRNRLQELLPAALVNKDFRGNPCIYSLYEACRVCKIGRASCRERVFLTV